MRALRDASGYWLGVRSADPGDDYLIALAAAEAAVIVSGDADLTFLAPGVPVRTPATFLAEVGT